ncbi:uncharacterized protein LOC128928182 isoform X1 [Callithrix jacchus]
MSPRGKHRKQNPWWKDEETSPERSRVSLKVTQLFVYTSPLVCHHVRHSFALPSSSTTIVRPPQPCGTDGRDSDQEGSHKRAAHNPPSSSAPTAKAERPWNQYRSLLQQEWQFQQQQINTIYELYNCQVKEHHHVKKTNVSCDSL